jgi:hypothetical protein
VEFLGRGFFGVGVFSDAVEFLALFFSVMLYFLGWAFSDFWAVVFFGFGILPSFASSYRFIFASFGCFCWLVCCSARFLFVVYFYFFKGS